MVITEPSVKWEFKIVYKTVSSHIWFHSTMPTHCAFHVCSARFFSCFLSVSLIFLSLSYHHNFCVSIFKRNISLWIFFFFHDFMVCIFKIYCFRMRPRWIFVLVISLYDFELKHAENEERNNSAQIYEENAL